MVVARDRGKGRRELLSSGAGLLFGKMESGLGVGGAVVYLNVLNTAEQTVH